MSDRFAEVLKWAGGIATVAALLSTVVGVWVYLERDRLQSDSWLAQDNQWNGDILSRLEAIEKELVKQTEWQGNLRSAAGQTAASVAADHTALTAAIYEAAAKIAFSLGHHEGLHHER